MALLGLIIDIFSSIYTLIFIIAVYGLIGSKPNGIKKHFKKKNQSDSLPKKRHRPPTGFVIKALLIFSIVFPSVIYKIDGQPYKISEYINFTMTMFGFLFLVYVYIISRQPVDR